MRPIIGFMKYFIALAFVGIFASLAFALFYMLKDGRNGRAKTGGMARALTFRIGLSVVLFLCMLLAWKFGYIQPTGLPVGK
jgi:phosphoglycerol transferase MdoB-like AlkP superfamily enzyme